MTGVPLQEGAHEVDNTEVECQKVMERMLIRVDRDQKMNEATDKKAQERKEVEEKKAQERKEKQVRNLLFEELNTTPGGRLCTRHTALRRNSFNCTQLSSF